MDRRGLINKVKYSSWLYNAYFYIGNLFISVIKLFVEPDDKLIVFVSAGGKSMTEGIKNVYDAFVNDTRFSDFKFVWAFRYPKKFEINKGRIIQIDSLEYYVTLIKARVWMTDVSMLRGLSFTGKQTIDANTWHGTPIKTIGKDMKVGKGTFVPKGRRRLADVMFAQSQYEADMYHSAFDMPTSRIFITGQPRNDSLILAKEKSAELRRRLNIPEDKKVILYAPTFRDYEKENGYNCILIPPITWNKWKEQLGDKYVVLFRAHPAVVKVMNMQTDEVIRDVSDYPSVVELMMITDIFISDYSGLLIDFSILGRPMFCFAYDYEKYCEARGLYFDIRKELKSEHIDTEDKLLEAIQNMDMNERSRITKQFREKYVEEYGNASHKIVDCIYDLLKK